ncbi:TetR/AcrR family transcriptional regulator [Cryptosporangium sp. NPDC051539]|uniref:TetR/AcrR family transcriptional regulator n=1 Tax=Cryptosporangium sp. NPDC051539 TaxID=3363962 RepID=UPI00378DEAE9
MSDYPWRERKKQATRDAIGAAALKLAMELGPENVRVDDIAAAAGVSPRTFNNYFSSREEAICAQRLQWAHQLGDAVRARPVTEPLDRALTEAIFEVRGRRAPDRAVIRMLAATPAMQAEYLRNAVASEYALADAIVARTGCDPLGAAVLGSAYAGAIRAASEYWLREDGDVPFTDYLRAALDRVAPAARALDAAPSPLTQSPLTRSPHTQSNRESQAC